MYDDVNCPYCDADQKIDHDDGYGYREDEIYQQECRDCGKVFVFTTSISFYYEAEKADCLNDSEHDFRPTHTIPREYTKMECSMCGKKRQPTESETASILNNERQHQKL